MQFMQRRILLHSQGIFFFIKILYIVHLLLQKALQNTVLIMIKKDNPFLQEMDDCMKKVYPFLT